MIMIIMIIIWIILNKLITELANKAPRDHISRL
jgi:hypothetical protein